MAGERSALRFDAAIATLVGFLALTVSGYSAYEQHLQVRAQVWPILELSMGNSPIGLWVTNKGVGPALVRDVIVRVDGRPVHTWDELIGKIVGSGMHHAHTASFNNSVLAAGERIDVFKPHDDAG